MSAVKPTIKRRESTKIYVGNVPIGGDAPIAVQSMTSECAISGGYSF